MEFLVGEGVGVTGREKPYISLGIWVWTVDDFQTPYQKKEELF